MGKKTDKQRHNVRLGGTIDLSRKDASKSSLASSQRWSRQSFLNNFALAIVEALQIRNEVQITMAEGSDLKSVTPPLLEDTSFATKLLHLNEKIQKNDVIASAVVDRYMKTPTKASGRIIMGSKASLVDVLTDITESDDESDDERKFTVNTSIRALPFIKIVLQRSAELILFEQRSATVARDSDAAHEVEEDNKMYDYLTMGKGRIRRTTSSETQTINIFYKSRDVNTERIEKAAVVSYVSNFEMFDTYKNLETTTKKVEVGEAQQINVTTYKLGGIDQFENISQDQNFKLALMFTLRMLAGNVFEKEQRRFRNMVVPDPLLRNVMFKYNVIELLSLNFEPCDKKRKAIADIAFCPGNGDIIAVAYGIYTYGMNIPDKGYCCIWNIKNPINPERIFSYNMAVVSVQFSTSLPQLLAIGLFDGGVEVRDIGNFNDQPVAVLQRVESSTCDPITSIKWLTQSDPYNTDIVEIDPFLAVSQDSTVTKYRVINSPYLLAFPQMKLDRIEGSPEGLLLQRPWYRSLSSRCPQGINMVLHPRYQDVYFVLTDDGCIHKCSTNYPHQHLEVLQVHNGPVSVMDYSPWSPKVFLTAGNDWHIRIWIEGIFEPLITLKNENSPILCAAWSKTHSTIIISNTRKIISVWDIRRSVLRPVSSFKINQGVYTLFKFSLCGRSIAIGKERSAVSIMALEDFPFPPHFQYEELELAIFKAIAMKPQLTNELKSIGFFGYAEHLRGHQTRCG